MEYEDVKPNTIISNNNQSTPAIRTGGNQNQCCAGCHEPIKDRFIFSVIDLRWHQDCVQCTDCSSKLNERCYEIDGKLYCKLDYWRRFGPKCFACRESIDRSELVQRIKGNRVYHLKCFTCNDCNKQLKTGEQLHLIDGKKLLCKHDYNQLAASVGLLDEELSLNDGRSSSSEQVSSVEATTATTLQQQEQQPQQLDAISSSVNSHHQHHHNLTQIKSANNNNDTSDDPLKDCANVQSLDCLGDADSLKDGANMGLDCGGDDLVDANGKRRGPRTTIKPKQLETLRKAFELAPKPSRHIREQLAAETGLNMRVIQVWFQNRRSKERRMKNSNGSARRNFFRSSSRRLGRVSAAEGAAPNASGNQGPQSLIAAGNQRGVAGSKKQQQQQQQQQQSPMDGGDQKPQQQVAQQRGQQNHSPSEFGGSSSGGFTYFSDSSNQGDAFAISTSQQQQPTGPQAQYLTNGGQDHQSGTLMALGSPATNNQNQASTNQTATSRSQAPNQQQQYQQMKNTPPPAPIYSGGPPPPPQQQHMMMVHHSGPPPLHQHLPGGHSHLQHQPPPQHMVGPGPPMMQQSPGMGMGNLLGHPQGPSVVQW